MSFGARVQKLTWQVKEMGDTSKQKVKEMGKKVNKGKTTLADEKFDSCTRHQVFQK